MYLIEKDTFLVESLKEIIDERVKIFNEDILKFDENSLSKKKIIELEVPTGNPLLIKFNESLTVKDYKYLDSKRKF